MSTDPAIIALLFGVLVVAGLVKGTIGFGLPLVAVSILTQWLSKEWALALIILPVVFSNLFLGLEGRHFVQSTKRFWPVIVAVCVGIMVGAYTLSAMPQQTFLLVVGLVVILFALAEQFKLVLPVPPAHERSVGFGAGLVGGLLGGMSTAYGPPVLMYLTALRLDKTAFIAAIGAIWSFASVTLIVAFNQTGILVGERILWSLGACVPVGIGLWVGSRLRERIAQAPFRRMVTIALFLLGANLIRRAVL